MNRFVGWLCDGYKQTIGYMYIYVHIMLCLRTFISSLPLIHPSISSSIVLGGEIKRCPFCKRIIEKTGGCDQMFCGQDAEGNGAVM